MVLSGKKKGMWREEGEQTRLMRSEYDQSTLNA
jgi:hypothetical protein